MTLSNRQERMGGRSAFNTAGRVVSTVFSRIEEPRIIRIFHFLIYLTLGTMGFIVVLVPPDVLIDVLGDALATSFGASLFVGGAVGAVAVLPGIWWAERVAIISLVSGLLMYMAVSSALDTSTVRIGLALGMILSLILRWIEVRKYQYAPGK